MKKSSFLLAAVAMMLAITVSANAQGGCVQSPENPTLVLGLVGSRGAFLASARARFKARRNRSNLGRRLPLHDRLNDAGYQWRRIFSNRFWI